MWVFVGMCFSKILNASNLLTLFTYIPLEAPVELMTPPSAKSVAALAADKAQTLPRSKSLLHLLFVLQIPFFIFHNFVRIVGG